MPVKSKTRRPLIAGNWKMNGLAKPAGAEIRKMLRQAAARRLKADIVICPPATLLAALAGLLRRSKSKRHVALGGQDCHAKAQGAHTGDIAAEMLKDAGAAFVIVGHSERRADHAESNTVVRTKAEAAHRAGLVAILCVGETLAERDSGRAIAVVESQLAGSLPVDANARNTVIAYEPVWAIGTGRTPSAGDIVQIHGFIRRNLAKSFADGADFRILYGGSVKPANAVELLNLANVDGALVGGASLTEADFWPIVSAKS
jgi:triosephosphate isomerase